jgi:HAD superfamily hydrolase (TIGR01450 family)
MANVMSDHVDVPAGRFAGVRVVLCDLDGVVWLARRAIPGSPGAVAALRSVGCRVLFVTNNSAALLADQEEALAAIGIEARGEVVTSAQAAALLVTPGERVLACAGPGVVEALEARGAVVTPGGEADGSYDAVVVGLHLDFDYVRLRAAATAVRQGARLIGTNDDATFPTPDGPIPGGGSILAAVATAAGVVPEVAGKPHQPMVELVQSMVPEIVVDPRALLMVGDRPSTDGRFAARLGGRFALVRSGVTLPGDPAGLEPSPDLDAPDLAAVARAVMGAVTRR